MAIVSVTDARGTLPELINQVREEAVFLSKHGEVEAVMISPQRYERMLTALEEVEDIAAFDAAMSAEDDNIPWDQVKADLGWQ